MTSIDVPLTVSATAFQIKMAGNSRNFGSIFFVKLFRVGKIYAIEGPPGNIIVDIKFS